MLENLNILTADQIREAWPLIHLLTSSVFHLFSMGYTAANNIIAEEGIDWTFLLDVIIFKIFTPLNDIFWTEEKAVIYSYVKNKYAIWILDSFLSFDVVKSEWAEKNWKNLILRASIYLFASQCWIIPYLIYSSMLALIAIAAAKKIFQDFIYPRLTTFDFQTLPLPFQQRFYELQNPVTRFTFSKAYFPLSLKSTYNKIYVDDLFIRRSERCHMIYQSIVGQETSPRLTLGCNLDAECKCPEGILSNICVVKAIVGDLLDPDELSYLLLSFIDFSNIKFLGIYQSILNLNDLEIISTMKLKAAVICTGKHETITIHEILEALIGVPHLRIWLEGECGSPDDFAVNIVEWVLVNGYIESLVIHGEFFGEKLDFKSSTEVRFDDTLE